MANQYSKVPTQRAMILQFIKDHPDCNSSAISEALGFCMKRIGQELSVLKDMGRVKSTRYPGHKSHSWSLTTERQEAKADKPRRIFTKEWTGHGRDEMVAAFFGAAA